MTFVKKINCKILLTCISLFILCFNVVHGINVYMNENITAGVNQSGIEMKCSYTKENVKTIFTVGLFARSKTTLSDFFTIVTFLPDKATVINPSGEYLSNRVTMTNITQESTEASLIFKQIKCTDKNQYRCKVTYLNTNNDVDSEISMVTTINVTVPPTKPHSLSITRTFASLAESENATFICKGNVGKPPGKFIWRKRRSGDNFPLLYTNEKTNHTKLEDSCSYEGISILTITLSDKDNQAIISCAEESLMSNDAMFKYTLPIDIFFKVQIPSIMKYPNRSRYSEEIEVIILTCLSNGNPSPTYSWYFNQTVIQAGSVFEIKNGRESDSGLYICNASNSFHGTKFEASNTVDIQIIKITENRGISSTNHSGTEVSAIVAAIRGLLAVIVIILVTWIFRRHKCRLINKNNNSTGKHSQEMNIYSTIDDNLYERTGPLDHHPYKEIVQISSTEDCHDKNQEYLTAVSIEDEHRLESIITKPKNLKANGRSYTNLEL